MRELFSMEAQYLREHPESDYLTEILPLKSFPDYIDYLPPGSYERKVAVMGYLPDEDEKLGDPIAISKEEYAAYVGDTIDLVLNKFREIKLIE